MNKHFIKATEECCSFEKYVPAPYIRKSFNLDFAAEKASVSICGLGFYRLFVNGEEITKGHLAPYISNPDEYCYYDTYEIEKLLVKGENVIGIILGNGFYNQFGGLIWEFDRAQWLGTPRTALEFTAEGNGKTAEFTADTSFKVHPSPIYFDDYRMGEYYDANNEIADWCNPGFDDSGWDNALAAEMPRGEMKLCEAEPIRVIREIKPVKISKSKNGYIYDFGVNTAGVCKLKFKGEKGQKISIQHGEVITDGELNMKNIGFYDRPEAWFYEDYNQKDIFVSDGTEKEYVPSFTYHGFRYVEVCGITDEQATEELLTYLEMSSDLKTIAEFECSDENVNKLYEMAVRSDRANFYYFPTDCPQREKNGWTGDASMSSDHMVMMYGVSASWHEWLNNIRKAQRADGALPGIVPTSGWGFAWGNGPAWDSVLFNLPYMLYKYRGDLDVIRENAAAMMRYLEYALRVRNADGTVSIGLGDWVPVNRDASDYQVPLGVTDTVMVMDMAKKAAEMFDTVGYSYHSDFARKIYADMRSAVRRKYVNSETGNVEGNCQSGQAICLYYGVFEKCEEQKAFELLLKYIRDNDNGFDCGFLGMHTIFHVLSDFGHGELAYHMITKKDFPSYVHWMEQGETAMPEMFMRDIGRSGSRNHHFLGDISRWFINRIAGICPIDDSTVEIKPDFISAIDHASAKLELPGGTAAVSWKREDGTINLSVNVSGNVSYKMALPENFDGKITINNK